MKYLMSCLDKHLQKNRYLFTTSDLRSVLPKLPEGAFKALLSRTVKQGILRRVCRGVYLHPKYAQDTGLLLFHTAALLRADTMNYISLETALSELGIISQIPMNQITIMSSGRSHRIDCGAYGAIEFIHTEQKASSLASHLTYDGRCHMWRADPVQAIKDMKSTRRNLDLINWDEVNELI